MNIGERNRASRWVAAIILSALMLGTGIVPPVTAQVTRFDCLLYRAASNGDVDQTSPKTIARQQSLYGCEGWLYATAIRLRHIVYGGWGSALLKADRSGRIGQDTSNQGQWRYPIVDYMQDLLNDQAQSLNNFWANQFSSSEVPYGRPGVVRVTVPISTMCKRNTMRRDSYYCPPDDTVYIGQGLLEAALGTGGNVTPALVLAHEWGHHIQSLLNILETRNQKNVELQADCFAGVYVAYEEGRGMLDPGDADSAVKLMFALGDDPNARTLSPWLDPNAHGTGQERVNAFSVGVKEGVQGCRNLRSLSR